MLHENIEDSRQNTTRFLIMSASPDDAVPEDGDVTPALFSACEMCRALYKALGGFATNNVNMTKLESYQPNGFLATQFYADIEGHPEDAGALGTGRAEFYCSQMDILGVYKAAPERAIARRLILRQFIRVNPRRRQRPSSVDAQSPCVAAPR